jgi:4-diphosphocytidyl-2-C-methyl-D-erythritol kinase
VTRVRAYAKVNLALVVGERRPDGLHEVASVLQRVDLADELELEEADELSVRGFPADTLVREALARLAEAIGGTPRWRVRIEKRIPVAAGLGGGSTDAGAALRAANESLAQPLSDKELAEVAAAVGADVPFFLTHGPKLAEGAGEKLTPLALPQDFWMVVALPKNAVKPSTGDVYRRYDELGGGARFGERRTALVEALTSAREGRDLAGLPPNDLAEAAGRPAVLDDLCEAGAFRADVSGAGPAVYGLFGQQVGAEEAAAQIEARASAWVAQPVW